MVCKNGPVRLVGWLDGWMIFYVYDAQCTEGCPKFREQKSIFLLLEIGPLN